MDGLPENVCFRREALQDMNNLDGAVKKKLLKNIIKVADKPDE